MSRIGNRPIKIDQDIKIEITGKKIAVSCGDKKIDLTLPLILSAQIKNSDLLINREDNSKEAKSQHGLYACLVKNAIVGVKDGFTKELTFKGTGYRASVQENEVVLNMGYSHEARIEIPKEISVVIKKNEIFVSGISKEAVGALAAKIRDVRGPEVYKGKGIKYKTETIKKKAGKKAATSS